MPVRKGYSDMPKKSDPEPKTREQLLTAAYGAASARVRDEHRDEFNTYYQEEAEKRGVEWTPRMTAEQRAEQTIRDLIDEFPHLAERLLRESDPDEEPVEPEPVTG